MSRADLRYDGRHEAKAAPAGSLNPDVPIAGYYRFKLRSGGHPVGVRIWHGPPADPETGELLDRSWRWQAAINGEWCELDRVWPQCGHEPIDEDEHDYLLGVYLWGKENAPDSPQAQPWKPIDFLAAPLPF